MKNLYPIIFAILTLSCNSQGGNVITANSDISSNNSVPTQVIAPKPKAYFINEKIASEIHLYSTGAFQIGSNSTNSLDNCILEVKITKHYNDNGYAFYDFYYYIYPENSKKTNCRNTIGITLYNIGKFYTNEQLDKMLNKTLLVYAPSITFNPVNTNDLIDYDCGTFSSIDVYDGWKFIDNISDYETIAPQINIL